MNHRMLAIVESLAAGLLGGCGGSCFGRRPGPASASAMCQALIPALGARPGELWRGLPGPYLGPVLALNLNCQNFEEAQAAGRVAFDQAKAKVCIDSVNAMTCAEVRAGGSLFTPACAEAVAPRVAPGGLCTSNVGIECVAGFCDQSATTACTTGGRCVTSATLGQPCAAPMQCAAGLVCGPSVTCEARSSITIVGAGANCASIGTACADGLYCDSLVTPRLCAPLRTAGATCSGTAPCLQGLYCDTASSRCLVTPKLGEACVQGQGRCAGNTYCGAANTCIPSPTVGADCRASAGELVVCQDSWCPPAVAPATARACTAFAAPGAACSTTTQLQCGYAYRCAATSGTSGVCGRNYCGG